MREITVGIAAVSVENLKYKYNELETPTVQLKLKISEILSKLAAECSTLTVITNAEYGIPLWCAEIAESLKLVGDNTINLSLVIPHDEQELTWYEQWRDRYYKIIELADEVKNLDEEYTEDCLEVSEYYTACDKYIADNSDVILAITTSEKLPAILNYVKEQKISTIMLDADNLKISQQQI